LLTLDSFWDWSLDWEDPMASPIFDPETGFGGDGDSNGPMHDGTHCVTDLPFKNMTPQWLGEKYDPHCLTRWFSDDWLAHYLNPESLETIMAATTYSEFFLALEMRAHDIIPMGIRGDFTSFTAPNGTSSCGICMLHYLRPADPWQTPSSICTIPSWIASGGCGR
jgi:tyrosinase